MGSVSIAMICLYPGSKRKDLTQRISGSICPRSSTECHRTEDGDKASNVFMQEKYMYLQNIPRPYSSRATATGSYPEQTLFSFMILRTKNNLCKWEKRSKRPPGKRECHPSLTCGLLNRAHDRLTSGPFLKIRTIDNKNGLIIELFG